MTVTLELKPDAEAAARAEAQAQGMPVENYLQTILEGRLLGKEQSAVDKRQAALNRIQSGYYARRLSPSDEFAVSKEGDKALEERHLKH